MLSYGLRRARARSNLHVSRLITVHELKLTFQIREIREDGGIW